MAINVETNPAVNAVFEAYPEKVRPKMDRLRQLVLEAAEETEGITNVEETLKWGEPSYKTKQGSTIRMDWKARQPDQYALYFQCTSQLVPTFRALYDNLLTFEGNRAIVFDLKEPVPEEEIKACLAAGLCYHKVKNLPLLGM